MQLLWVVLILVLLAGYLLFRKERKRIDAILERIALERKGVVRRVFGSYSQLSFHYKSVEIQVSAMAGGSTGGGMRASQTFAQFSFPGYPKEAFFRVREKSLQALVEGLLGARELSLGDPGFEERFSIQGRDGTLLRRILTPEIRQKIAAFPEGEGISVCLEQVRFFDGKSWEDHPRLRVSRSKVSTRVQDYTELIGIAEEIYDRMASLLERRSFALASSC
ncbi:MAG TPA: hypothetical protein ENK02_11370 [Planctomycetes bacterium]|nr:hypothetical protein [Planctomycetota bacterium]